MSFVISALPVDRFAPLFDLDDAALAELGGVRVTADAKPGYPCRVSLADAEVGERLILVHHEHHAAATPFRASHAVYVREAATPWEPRAAAVPALFATRVMSVRAFDAAGMMRDAALTPGTALAEAIARMLADAGVAYLHLHYAAPGCYAARVDRSDQSPIADA